MENFDEFIKQRLFSLPQEIQKAFSETDIVGEIEKIRVKFKLMYDQASVLESETMLIFLGLEEPKYLLRNIVKNAKIPTDIAGQIVDEIEKNILKQIKSRLIEIMEQEDEENKKNEESKENSPLDKDSILAEIENPVPTFQTKSAITPVNTEKIPENLPTIKVYQTIENYTPPSMPVKSIVERKLSEPTRIPPKEIEVSLKKIPDTPTQIISTVQKYTADPYKEPIA